MERDTAAVTTGKTAQSQARVKHGQISQEAHEREIRANRIGRGKRRGEYMNWTRGFHRVQVTEPAS